MDGRQEQASAKSPANTQQYLMVYRRYTDRITDISGRFI